MFGLIRTMFARDDGVAAIEAAFIIPIFLVLTMGIADFGMGMFEAIELNAAAQAGAIDVVFNNGATSGAQPIMKQAADDNTSITATVTLAGGIVTATASYDFVPVIPWSIFPQPLTSRVTVRLQ
jgi:Flp pilus assembly protein TadG